MEPAPTSTVADPASREKLKRRQQLRILAACVVIATILWFLRAFENEYATTVHHPIRYVNLPEKMTTLNPLPDRISLEVKGLGFSILKHNWNFSKTPLLIDVKLIKAFKTSQKKGFDVRLPMNQFLNDFSAQLRDLRVLAVKPDTLNFRFAVRKTKILPVMAVFSNDSGTASVADSLVLIKPAVVEVTGPDLLVDSMKQVVTLPVKIKRKGAAFSTGIGLRGREKLLKFNPDKVTVTILENR